MGYITQTLNTECNYSGPIVSLSWTEYKIQNARATACELSYDQTETHIQGFMPIDTISGTQEIRSYHVILNMGSMVRGSVRTTGSSISLRLSQPLMFSTTERRLTYGPDGKVVLRDSGFQKGTTGDLARLELELHDNDPASRLANALNHAMELCGGLESALPNRKKRRARVQRRKVTM